MKKDVLVNLSSVRSQWWTGILDQKRSSISIGRFSTLSLGMKAKSMVTVMGIGLLFHPSSEQNSAKWSNSQTVLKVFMRVEVLRIGLCIAMTITTIFLTTGKNLSSSVRNITMIRPKKEALILKSTLNIARKILCNLTCTAGTRKPMSKNFYSKLTIILVEAFSNGFIIYESYSPI